MYYINTAHRYSGISGLPNNYFPTNLNQNMFGNNFGIPGFSTNLSAPIINYLAYFNKLGFNNFRNPPRGLFFKV
jgi:hypothetical protein